MTPFANHRILLVDDNPAIHEDFRKILAASRASDASLAETESLLFGAAPRVLPSIQFELESAFQGREALEKVTESLQHEAPYAMAFIDVRMPPGWDGIETIEHLWRADPNLQVVVCTAYSDYSWEKMTQRLGVNENLVILKKPFDNIEVLQLAHALTKKWAMTQQAQLRLETLSRMVDERTRDLQSANAELRRSEERFATAFRASPIPLAIQTLGDERFIDVNDAFTGLTEIARDEMIGSTPAELQLGIRFDEETGHAARAGKAVRNAEAEITTRSGASREALVSTERIRLGNEPHILVMVQDISQRVRLETQLRHAQKMEAIGQLAAGVAHDFNNLLTIVEGHASLQLACPDLLPDVADSFEQIEQAAERAANLTRQLLAFSRRQIMRTRIVDLNTIVRDFADGLRRTLPANVSLTCELGPTHPRISADRASFEQVLANLGSNALEAMPIGGSLTFRTCEIELDETACERHPELRPGRYARIEVIDTGIGMAPATLARIFEPFFTTKEASEGTGLGLATCYGIVKQHSGCIEAESEVHIGSTFRLYVPATEAEPEAPPERVPKATKSVKSHSLLLVEDDEAVRNLVSEILQQSGYTVFAADGAEAALNLWSEYGDEIDLLLTDIVMPGAANGVQLAELLLADKPNLKVVYTSGYSSDLFSSGLCLEEGSNYLPKPYLSTTLVEVLRNALNDVSAPC